MQRRRSVWLLRMIWLLGLVVLSACGSARQDSSVAPTATAIPEDLKLVPEPTAAAASELAAATRLGFNIRGWT